MFICSPRNVSCTIVSHTRTAFACNRTQKATSAREDAIRVKNFVHNSNPNRVREEEDDGPSPTQRATGSLQAVRCLTLQRGYIAIRWRCMYLAYYICGECNFVSSCGWSSRFQPTNNSECLHSLFVTISTSLSTTRTRNLWRPIVTECVMYVSQSAIQILILKISPDLQESR